MNDGREQPLAETSLRSRLQNAFQLYADLPALNIDGRRWSYADLFDEARAWIGKIDQLAAPGRCVGIWCQRDLASLSGVLATLLSGRAYVPMNPTFPLERLAKIVSIARPAVVLSSDDNWKQADALAQHATSSTVFLTTAGDALPGKIAEGDTANRTLNGDLAYVMFTSGTTGVPKGVCIRESNLLAYLDGISEVVQIGPGDRATHFFDLSFDLSVHDVLVTWLAGAELNVLPRTKSMAIPEFIRENGITHWFSVPSLAAFCSRLGQLVPDAMPTLKSVLFCGEALPTTIARDFLAAAPNAVSWNIYGPTEATIAFTAHRLTAEALSDAPAVVPIGRPFGKNEIRLEPCGEPEDGGHELLLGGLQVSPGYLANAEQTAARFSVEDGKSWYRTGDLVRWSEDHGLIFLGRSDDQVKINGYRVELAEIESALRNAAETDEVAALPWPSAGAAQEILGFVVDPGVDAKVARDRCRKHLPAYMVPRRILALDAMPLTASGKIDRKALAALAKG